MTAGAAVSPLSEAEGHAVGHGLRLPQDDSVHRSADADRSGQVEDEVDPADLTAHARLPRLRSVVISPVARLAVGPAALLERDAAGDHGERPPPELRTLHIAGEIRDRPPQPLA